MPEVELRLYASLRRYVDGQAVVRAEIQSGETVGGRLPGHRRRLIGTPVGEAAH